MCLQLSHYDISDTVNHKTWKLFTYLSLRKLGCFIIIELYFFQKGGKIFEKYLQ